MRVVLQRVRKAAVQVDDAEVGAIDHGLLALVCVGKNDVRAQVEWLAAKVANLRIFSDADGRFAHSVLDVGGGVLVVSQFTLLGVIGKGRRPSFDKAAPPDEARRLYEAFCDELTAAGVARVERGTFAAHMQVELVNDGPVTLVLDR